MFAAILPLGSVLYFVCGFLMILLSFSFKNSEDFNKLQSAIINSIFYAATTGCFAICLFIFCRLGFEPEADNFKLLHYYGGFKQSAGIEHSSGYGQAIFALLASFAVFVNGFSGYGFGSQKSLGKLCRLDVFNKSLSLFAAGAFVGLAYSNDIFNIYVFIEVASISLYSMLALSPCKKALNAAFNYLIAGSVASCFFVLGIIILYNLCGSLNLSSISTRLALGLGAFNQKLVILCYACFLLAGLIKCGSLAFFAWLTNLYQSLNPKQMPFVAAIGSKMGIFIIYILTYRIFNPSLLHIINQITLPMYLVSILSFACAAVAMYFALRFNSIQAALAGSSIVYNSFILIFIILCGTPWLSLAFVQMLCHGIITSLIFWTISSTASNNTNSIVFESKAQVQIFKFLMILLTALPPSPLFVAKFVMFKMLYANQFYLAFVLCLVASGFCMLIYYKIITHCVAVYSLKAKPEDANNQPQFKAKATTIFAIGIVFAGLCLCYYPFVIEALHNLF